MINATQTVGKSTLRVPALGFGTAPLAAAPGWRSSEPIPETQAVETLHAAIQQGVRFFDTAPAYGCGLAEQRAGLVLSQIPRDQVVIATKVGFEISDGTLRRDYTRDGVLRSLEGSLKRLKIDSVDLLHVHDPDDFIPQVLDETFPALEELRSQGVIKAIGAGMNQWQAPLQLAQQADFDCFLIAGRYTLLEQGALPLFDLCLERGIRIFAASIYNSGILATGAASAAAAYNHGVPSDEIRAKVARLEAICNACEISLHAAATHFPTGHPAVASLVVGFQHPSEIQACLDALAHPVPSVLWERLRAAGLLDPHIPIPTRK